MMLFCLHPNSRENKALDPFSVGNRLDESYTIRVNSTGPRQEGEWLWPTLQAEHNTCGRSQSC